MSKKIIWQALIVTAVIVVILFGLSAVITRNEISKEEEVLNTSQTETITLTIEGIYDDRQVLVSESTTVLGLLRQLDEESEQMKLVTKEYGEYGVLVESMGGKTNGDEDEFWQYRINGVMPQIGADKLKLNNGDSVEWYFEASEF